MESNIFTRNTTQTESYVWIDKLVLVAEDVDLNFLYIRELLEPTGITIIRVLNGRDAVDACKENIAIDLVLMDLLMPVMNGYEATRQIKAIRPDLPIIAQTAYAITEDRNKALHAGCNDFVAKPIGKEELLQKMNSFFQIKSQ
jgi:CheY-like chemotaxis protein